MRAGAVAEQRDPAGIAAVLGDVIVDPGDRGRDVLGVERVAKLRSVRYYGGMPLDARTVTDDIVRQEGL